METLQSRNHPRFCEVSTPRPLLPWKPRFSCSTFIPPPSRDNRRTYDGSHSRKPTGIRIVAEADQTGTTQDLTREVSFGAGLCSWFSVDRLFRGSRVGVTLFSGVNRTSASDH